ncbi:Fis family transcriptional regulator [Salipaludibacillus keqinensis]|uniref:Fis family transcriptional regulator n=1 Tax=Salipaludibacillus keqinensis TaxID=2045207 RepID=A0A323TLW9_9BACI|nr:sigma 54-interacting transcriptional regulator [Salipaludibacillus keqinensis]PYZ93593.1 Fis family transcriptional regulator [Salipaludibacillus keqinensis]
MKKPNRIILIAGSKETKKTLVDQLEDIIGDFVQISGYSAEDDILPVFENEVVLLSSSLMKNEVAPYISDNCKQLIANRIVNFLYIDQLFELPNGTEVLYVNDYPETVNEAIESLRNLGVDHLKYYPYFPGKKMVKRIPIAITPGEMDLVPDFIETTINIRPRLIDMSSIIAILSELDIANEKNQEVSNRYIQKIIDLSKRISDTTKEATRISEHLKKVVDGVHDGILAVNNQGIITVFNGIMEGILHIRGKRVIGKPIQDVLMNKELVSFVLENKGESNRYFTIEQADIIVHKFSMESDGTKVVTFKNAGEAIEMENKRRRELLKKGHFAKYTFEDIIGQNDTLLETKRIAKKLAKSDLTILIEGESGTGKELFASSIHNESNRRQGPYLAVNFSALPEDLVESELFGYEEGAFTGAKKGGRKGLFEQAHGGTIFLDEIGDISLKVQARLLRVLQEKELLRIGGNEIIPVDVRVIAATNRHLLTLIEKNQFREDLYHRLKVLFLHLPELRFRKEDVDGLIRYFIHQSGMQDVKVHPAVFQQLRKYHWYGNIRELKNTIDYMLTVCENHEVLLRDIPNESFFQGEPKEHLFPEASKGKDLPMTPALSIDEEELYLVLQVVLELEAKETSISRQKIVKETEKKAIPLTEQQVRYRLQLLSERGYVKVHRGRVGTRITEAGKQHLESLIKS